MTTRKPKSFASRIRLLSGPSTPPSKAPTVKVAGKHCKWQISSLTGGTQNLRPRYYFHPMVTNRNQDKPFQENHEHKNTTLARNFSQNPWSRVDELIQKTEPWLKLPLGSWTNKDVSVGRWLMEDWLRLPTSNSGRPLWAHRVLRRWIQERAVNNSIEYTSSEVLEMLHRVLHAQRLTIVGSLDENAYEASLDLINAMENLYWSTNDDRIRPGSKAYSMVLQILALSILNGQRQSNPEDAFNLLQRCLDQNVSADIVVWNSCLHVLAKQSLHQSNGPEEAEKLLDYMMLKSSHPIISSEMDPPSPDVNSFASVLDAWANLGRPAGVERADAILKQMILQDNPLVPKPNTACFNICIGAYAKNGDINSAQRAQDLLDYMINSTDDRNKPDHISFLATLNAWAKCTDDGEGFIPAENAEALLQRMKALHEDRGDAQIRPTAACHTAVLDAWARTPDSGPKVEMLLRKMQEDFSEGPLEQGVDYEELISKSSPLTAAYLAAIHAWGNTCNNPDALVHAERILDEMGENVIYASSGKPDFSSLVRGYSAVIGAWASSERLDAPSRALELLRRMQDGSGNNASGIVPNTVVFNCVLNAFARRGDAQAAMALLQEMKALRDSGDSNVKPDTISYSTVINAFARSRVVPSAAKQATVLLEELIDIYYRTNDPNMRPTEFAYSSAILAWGNSKEMDCAEQAEEILWKMVGFSNNEKHDSNVARPNTIVCNCVLRAWSRSQEGGAPERAEAILDWMNNQVETKKNAEVNPDRKTFNYVMQAWSKSGRAGSTRRIEELLNRMIVESKNDRQHLLFPNAVSFNCLLEATKNSRRNDKAKKCQELLEQLLESSKDATKLWNLHSFHLVFLVCLNTSKLENGSRLMASDVLSSTFEHLKTADQHISERTVELILLAYTHIGISDELFLLEVFQFCHHTGVNQIDMAGIIEKLRDHVSADMHYIFSTCELRAQNKTKNI